ncbi:MAG TPA: efflux RND transporter permease subunit, partial [Patescibacteria group bacterium]|nr:efflux RND transporter permease subunit [Patescibacteria group bacterium]
ALPGGNFEGKNFNYSIRTDGRFFDAKEIGNLPVSHGENNSIIYLRDIADVKEQAIKRTVNSRFSESGSVPQESVSIEVLKKTGGSIIDTADKAKAKIDEMVKTMPTGITDEITIDIAKEIRNNFDQLVHDFLITIVLVFGILLLVVGLKEAVVASLAIPLVFFVTFAVMLVTGISLNFLSMVSLILALGLLVDDAIVVVSATKQYLKTGKFTPEEAVLLVLNDFKVVLATTTLATVWAFLPLLFSSGIMGEYIRSIPIVVSVTLLASLVIALIINHPLAAILERVRTTRKFFAIFIVLLISVGLGAFYLHNIYYKAIALSFSVLMTYWLLTWYFHDGKEKLKKNEELMDQEWNSDELIKEKLRTQGNHRDSSFSERLIHGIVHFDKIIPIYEKFLLKVLATRKSRWKTIGLVTILLIVAIAMPVSGIVKSEFFPVTDSELMFINIEAPVGLKLEETGKIASLVEEKLMKYPEIINFSTVVGSGGSGFGFGGSSSTPSNEASITVKLKEKKDRNIKSYDLAEKIRQDIKEISGANITVQTASGGPPAGNAFEARIMGDDLTSLEKIASDLKPVLSGISGVVNADISLKDAPADYTFSLDHDRMELLGVNAVSVGSTLRMAISGAEVTDVLKDGDEIKVMARYAENKIPDLESLNNLQIKNNQNQSVFLKDIANIKLEPSVDKITRVNQKRTVLLS